MIAPLASLQHAGAAALLVTTIACSGCASRNHASSDVSSAQVASPPRDVPSETERLLAEELNSAQIAARTVAGMPAVRSTAARREILLQASLYRAAYETNVGDWTTHFVLEPVKENDPPDIGIAPEEFRLRVLGALDNVGQPMAWVAETWRSNAVDYFPGTEERATRLQISILQRNDNTGVVLGEVGDQTADVGASKQRVTCRWDGRAWQIERDPVRMVW